MKQVSNKYPLYRGKSIETGEWVYGVPFEGLDNVSYLLPKYNYQGRATEVYSNTLGENSFFYPDIYKGEAVIDRVQYFYEGDIVRIVNWDGDTTESIIYRFNNSLCANYLIDSGIPISTLLEKGVALFKLGNVFDNIKEAIQTDSLILRNFVANLFLCACTKRETKEFLDWCNEVKLQFSNDLGLSLFDYILSLSSDREDTYSYDRAPRPIANFPISVDLWVYQHCPIEWVRKYIRKKVFPGFKLPKEIEYYGEENSK